LAAGCEAADCGRLVVGRAERDDGAPSAELRADTRKLRAPGESDDELEDALEEARECDAPSLSADAVAMPSEVPTPRKIARAPTRPMYLEYPAGAFSVRFDCCIGTPRGHE